MKSIYKMKQERASKLEEMKALVTKAIEESRARTEDESKRYNELDEEVKQLDAAIREYDLQEELNKRTEVVPEEEVRTEDEKPISVRFRDFLKDAIENGKTATFRADPLLTGTQAGLIEKKVAGIDILQSPGEAFLRQLGVTFFPGLTGNFVVPAMAEDLATFPGEDASAASANMAPDALTLAARRVTHTQSITRETLAQTNPAVYTSILQNLVNGVWSAVTYDLFDTLQTDAATRIHATTAGGLTNADLVAFEASIGGLLTNAPAYVTTPTVKAYLKGKIALGTTVGPAIWDDNEINGYPAYAVPAANANKVYFGDFSRMAVGQWDGLEIIVDPYSGAKQGRITLTVVGLFDTGCFNTRAVVWSDDVSAGL